VTQLDEQRKKIDAEKLRAVGLRNRAVALEEDRKRRQADLRESVADRRAELERVNRELDQLLKVKLGQEALINKMSTASDGEVL